MLNCLFDRFSTGSRQTGGVCQETLTLRSLGRTRGPLIFSRLMLIINHGNVGHNQWETEDITFPGQPILEVRQQRHEARLPETDL